MSIVAAKLVELQAQLDNHAIRSTPAEELHLLLATGALSPALHHFLIVILGQLSPVAIWQCFGLTLSIDVFTQINRLFQACTLQQGRPALNGCCCPCTLSL